MRERAADLMNELWPLFRALPRPSAHWIVTPSGEYESNNGNDWCFRCGDAIVRHLRRQDRKHREDYILDGGWRAEHDHLVHCAHCGETLDGSLTREGAAQELELYEYYGVRPANAYDAMALYETLNTLEWAKTPDDIVLALEACDLAEALLWSAT